MIGLLQAALEKACPLKPWPPPARKPKFWTGALLAERQRLRQLHRRYSSTGNEDDWDAYTAARQTLKRNLRHQKRETWQEFTTKLKGTKAMAQLSRCLRNKRNRRLDILESPQASPTDTLALLMSTHFPGCTPATARQPLCPRLLSLHDFMHQAEAHFVTEERVRWSVSSFGPDKAPGPDGITARVLQKCGPFLIKRLTRLYRASLLLAYVPRRLCKQDVIFIPKMGKKDYSDPKSYRPISLTSVLLKVLERVVLNEMELTSLKSKPMSRRQHAFRKGSSCDSALSSLVDTIESATLRGEYALGVFLDIRGAFDNLELEAAVTGLRRAGTHNVITEWYADYLYHRTAAANIKGQELRMDLVRGTPQGGVLSPVIWNLAFEEFIQLYEDDPVDVNVFADDAALVIRGKDPSIMVDFMQAAINKAVTWGRSRGLTFSREKTVCVVFTRKRRPLSFPHLQMGGPLLYSNQVKYLGVTLDAKLTFKAHIIDKCKKATRLMAGLRGALGQLWGPRLPLMTWAYQAMVRPIFLYGAVVWGHRARDHQPRLRKLQRTAMLSFGHFLRSTPTRGLELAFNLSPLHLLAEERANMSVVCIRGRNPCRWDGVGHHGLRGHLRRTDTGNIPLSDYRTPEIRWGDLPSIDYDSFLDGRPMELVGTTSYSDGSQTGTGPVGYGFVIPGAVPLEGKGSLGEDRTVFQGEVVGIHEAARTILENGLAGPYSFYIDSQASILALGSHSCDSITVHDCRQTLAALRQRGSVTLRWVKAHAGHPGNERADALAN